MTADSVRLYKKLNRVGEQVVRANLARGVYGENRRELVEEWLEQFQERSEAEAAEDEALETAREAYESAQEENRLAGLETPLAKWYERPLGRLGLMATAGLIAAYLIYIFGWY